MLGFFRRKTASDHARALGKLAQERKDAHEASHREKVRAVCREICGIRGIEVPQALKDEGQ